VFIHGLWLHASSWQPWVRYFNRAGYHALAPGWPDFPSTVADARIYPEFMYDLTIDQIVEHYARICKRFVRRPIVIGHSFGGLVAQRLLDQRAIAAAVAIDPAPVRGVMALPFAQLRSAWPVLGNPLTLHRAVSLKPKQFRYAFANCLSDSEAAELYERWTIPAPGRPLWEAALANFSPNAQTKVSPQKSHAPLLLMAGQHDHTVPPETTRLVRQLYAASSSRLDLKEWPGRGHSLVIDHGWQDIADYTLAWLHKRRIR